MIYTAVTHDEEIGSEKGAAGIVEWMKALLLLNGLILGVNKHVASINLAEKGLRI
jgi:hypothetical protein